MEEDKSEVADDAENTGEATEVQSQVDLTRVLQIVEGALLASGEPLSVERLVKLFPRSEISREDARNSVRAVLEQLQSEAEGRGYEVVRVASGYRYQVRAELSPWISRLWEERPPRYTRALLETLALIAYKQPVTRGDIESVRGVAVSPNIIRTLMERNWIREVGHREVPGRPVMYGTSREFLDYFNLKSLDQLPPLNEIRSLIEPAVVADDVLQAPRTLELPEDDAALDDEASAAEDSDVDATEDDADAYDQLPSLDGEATGIDVELPVGEVASDTEILKAHDRADSTGGNNVVHLPSSKSN